MSDLINYRYIFLNALAYSESGMKAQFCRFITPTQPKAVDLSADECRVLESRGELSNASLLDTQNSYQGRAALFALEQVPT